MIIKRLLYQKIKESLEPQKVIVLYGPRRVGKTYLLQQLLKDPQIQKEKVNFFKGDSIVVQEKLSSRIPEQLISYVGRETTLLIIDEAQKIPYIGDNLKILVDYFPKLKIVASGSASFDLAQKVGEPLTGRQKKLLLYPVSAAEITVTKNLLFYQEFLEEHLIYGGYPEIFGKLSLEAKKYYLDNLIDAYLFRDILEIEHVKNAKKLRDLLMLLAFQIGNEVSLSELGNNLDLHKDTVARYLDLLEKSFILVNIRGFSRNLRKEISKNSRWYFWDNGVRNALINNFNPLKLRNDVGMLWENFIIIERLKKQQYGSIYANNYFWRTWDKKEIDWVEEREGKLFGFEIKYQPKKIKPPKLWQRTYKNATYQIVNKDNFLEFIT